MPERKQLCTFWIDELLFGIDVRAVQEVLRSQPLRRVPLAADSIRGLINLRGQVLTAIDARVCLDLPPQSPQRDAIDIIVRSAQEPVSLVVDAIGEILEVDESEFEPPPESLRDMASDLLVGIYRLDERLLIVLDVELVVERGLTMRKGNNAAHEKNPLAAGR
jgi:purine-binding chemotaxis protein CheW